MLLDVLGCCCCLAKHEALALLVLESPCFVVFVVGVRKWFVVVGCKMKGCLESQWTQCVAFGPQLAKGCSLGKVRGASLRASCEKVRIRLFVFLGPSCCWGSPLRVQ